MFQLRTNALFWDQLQPRVTQKGHLNKKIEYLFYIYLNNNHFQFLVNLPPFPK